MPRRPAYLDVQFILLTAFVLAVSLPRLAALPVWGEEPRWAVMAREMMASGNYVVPTSQQVIYPDRPPLLSWTMIGAAHLLGGLSLTAVRLPSALAALLLCWLIYWYARAFLSPVGALAAGVAFPTMGIMLEFDRIGQTDALLTLCITASLLLWHMGYLRRWPPLITWPLGYGLAALAALAKGPQGPVYFIAATVMVLAVERDLKFLWSRAHLVGVLVFAVVLGAWLVPFTRMAGVEAAAGSFSENGWLPGRFSSVNLRHVLTFPGEVWGSLLPWSIMLAHLLHGKTRRRVLDAGAPQIRFVAVVSLVVFASCWWAAEARPRHAMAAFPLAAIAIGAVIDRTWRSGEDAATDRLRRGILLFAMAAIALTATMVGLGAVATSLQRPWFAPTPTFALVYGAAAAGAILCVRAAMNATTPRQACACLLAIAGYMGLTYTGPVLDAYSGIRSDAPEQAMAVRAQVPADAVLFNLGWMTNQQFAYFYGRPIKLRPWPVTAADVDPSLRYFCFVLEDSPVLALPFQWRQIAVVSGDQRRAVTPRVVVIVGRRLDGDDRDPSAP